MKCEDSDESGTVHNGIARLSDSHCSSDTVKQTIKEKDEDKNLLSFHLKAMKVVYL